MVVQVILPHDMAKKHGITVEWYYGMKVKNNMVHGSKKVWYYHNSTLKRISPIVKLIFEADNDVWTPDTQKVGAKITKPLIASRRETAACL